LNDREKYVNKVSEEIEIDLELVGSTAIEDKLQDNVADVIKDIREAGIKFWVLTGDKIETAINIGFSCNVLDEEMEIFIKYIDNNNMNLNEINMDDIMLLIKISDYLLITDLFEKVQKEFLSRL